jgi:ankyrin repeat protein
MFLLQLRNLLRNPTIKRRIKIVLTSRPHIQVDSDWTDVTVTQIQLTAENLKSDIEAFIESGVQKQFTGDLRDEVRQALIDGANGMFLWVFLILEEFRTARSTTPRATRQRLKVLPRNLSEVYGKILRDIQPEDQEIAENILQWVTWAMRPLTLEELTIAIAIRPESTSMSSIDDDVERDLKQVLRLIFGPMLRIELDNTVHLVHQSAKDFLVENHQSIFRLSQMECNLHLALSCLVYLSFDECDAGPVKGSWLYEHFVEEQIESRQEKMRLLLYAATHWPNHARQAEQARTVQNRLSGAFQKLAESPRKLDLAYQLLFFFSLHGSFEKTEPLQIAASLGFVAFVEDFLEKGADANAQGGKYGNALQAAASSGHEAIVRLLVEKGADVNARGGRYGNALQAAAEDGHEATVRLLIEKGANVNAQDDFKGNALQGAARYGHEAVVRLLIEKGANVNAQGGFYGNALQGAASSGHEAVVRLLVEQGADVNAQGADGNAQGGFYGNALQAAAGYGHKAVVRLLIEKGADVNARGGLYGNALQEAARYGHEAVVRLLIENGADVNAQGGKYGNALQAAAIDGHEAIVRLLIEKGAVYNQRKPGPGCGAIGWY